MFGHGTIYLNTVWHCLSGRRQCISFDKQKQKPHSKQRNFTQSTPGKLKLNHEQAG